MSIQGCSLRAEFSLRLVLVAVLPVWFLVGCGSDAPELDAAETVQSHTNQAKAIAAATSNDGAILWASCAACHGAQGEGNRELAAPALVNQNAWYLKRQLQHFRSGLRGAAADDTLGAQMALMAQALPGETAVDNLVTYITEELEAAMPAATVDGDTSNGRDHYDMVCGACHGPAGEGNELLGAPRLHGTDDWYLVSQYQNFAKGLRGTDATDKYGKQMRMMSTVLPDQQTLNDVVAYIQAQSGE